MEDPGGATIDSWFDKTMLHGIVICGDISAEMGATSQMSGEGGGEARALSDQFIGKWGPMLGSWEPEKFARMSSEF